MQKLGPRDFKHLFEETPGGVQVLEHLVARFGGASYRQGGLEADRETCYRLGQRSVIDYLLALINRANGVHDETKEND